MQLDHLHQHPFHQHPFINTTTKNMSYLNNEINLCSCLPDTVGFGVKLDGTIRMSAGIYKSPMHGQPGIKGACYSMTPMKDAMWWDKRVEGEDEYKGEDEDWWLSSWEQLLDDDIEDNAMDAIEANGLLLDHAAPLHYMTSITVHQLDKVGKPLTTYNSYGTWAYGDIIQVPMTTYIDHGRPLHQQQAEIPRGFAMHIVGTDVTRMLVSNMTYVMQYDTSACGFDTFAVNDVLINDCLVVVSNTSLSIYLSCVYIIDSNFNPHHFLNFISYRMLLVRYMIVPVMPLPLLCGIT